MTQSTCDNGIKVLQLKSLTLISCFTFFSCFSLFRVFLLTLLAIRTSFADGSFLRIKRNVIFISTVEENYASHYSWNKCQDSILGIVTKLQAEQSGVWIPVGISSPIHQVPSPISPWVQQLGHESDHSPTSSANIKKEYSYISIPTICLHGMCRRNFNFTIYELHYIMIPLFSTHWGFYMHAQHEHFLFNIPTKCTYILI